MSPETWLAFVAASVVLLVLPGPTILTVISYSLAQGRRTCLPLVAAVALGDSTALALSLLGLGALLAVSVFWFTLVKLAGGLYLLHLGFSMLRASARPVELLKPTAEPSRWQLFLHTYLVTALNPKGMVFFTAFLPQFVQPGEAAAQQLWILAATFVGLAIMNATLYAQFAQTARQLLSSRQAQRRFQLLGGSLLTAAGLWALLARRSG